jgi:hypothetical protein
MRGHLSGGHGSGCRDHGLASFIGPELGLEFVLTLLLDSH